MVIDVLVNEPRVVNESIDLCKWFVYDQAVFDLAQNYFQDLCLSPALFDAECWQLSCATYDTTYVHKPTQDAFQDKVRTVTWENQVFMEGTAEALVYNPAFNMATLGLYSVFK